jgi:hypothetical protein
VGGGIECAVRILLDLIEHHGGVVVAGYALACC